MEGIIYADANSTTAMCKKAIDIGNKYRGIPINISSSNGIATLMKEKYDKNMENLKNYCGANKKWEILITSGATESNCTIFRMVANAVNRELRKQNINQVPTFIISSIEHSSIIECCNSLVKEKMIDLVKIGPDDEGKIDPEKLIAAIKNHPLTAFVSIMSANNELGTYNNITELGNICSINNIPFHSDMTQSFAKIKPHLLKINAFSASAHKFHGPLGIGILGIHRDFIEGYELSGIINGKQQNELRGGTNNFIQFMEMCRALEYTVSNRRKKNANLVECQIVLLKELAKFYPIKKLKNFVDLPGIVQFNMYNQKITTYNYKNPIEIAVLGVFDTHSDFRRRTDQSLPNTLMISVVKNISDSHGPFCNVKLKRDLESKFNIIVSIGSACNTESSTRSHVIEELNVPTIVARGVIRISFDDSSKVSDAKKIASALIECINYQISIKNKNEK